MRFLWVATLVTALPFVQGASSIVETKRLGRPSICPDPCSDYNSGQWFLYTSPSKVAECNQTMLLDFTIHKPLNSSLSHPTVRACLTSGLQSISHSDVETGTSCRGVAKQAFTQEVGITGTSSSSEESNQGVDALGDIQTYMTGNCLKGSIFAVARNTAAGVYVGGSVSDPRNIQVAIQTTISYLESSNQANAVFQLCGSDANSTIGVAVSLTGDLSAVQGHVQTWSNGRCISDLAESIQSQASVWSTHNVSSHVYPSSNGTISSRSPKLKQPSYLDRRATCSTIQVNQGDGCPELATRCGINAADFTTYNPGSDLCSTLKAGQHVCCSSGTLPDYTPSEYANGTCYTHWVQSGDLCSYLAAAYDLTEDLIEEYNTDTWGWYGCGDLQLNQGICLSEGTSPLPAAVANAVCGPQVPGTDFSGTSDANDWALLNPCPLNACCDAWGQCGITPDYCNGTLASTGAPGTSPPNSNGCVSNCGTDIVNNDSGPESYMSVGYFEATNGNRPCLNMNAFSINPDSFTHVHFGFANISSEFEIDISGAEEQFTYFQELSNVKRIVSFGGWDFSTDPDTYAIFRDGVTEANRGTLIDKIVSFVIENDLDGVDFDWEYPGEPDIKGIPAGSADDGTNYLAFLSDLREQLPGSSISIAAPASFYYLQGFPIANISEIVDYIVYMAYDLHGTWDLGNAWAQPGCSAGDCLFSHVNLTETMWSLAMITKAGVQAKKVTVGVSSYGRSFEMTTEGCTGPSCTWDAAGLAGECTGTAGYLANAEINEILSDNPSATKLFDSGSDSDILVYNETQWVGYMTSTTKSTRASYYKSLNFAGTTEWAIDLETFTPYDAAQLNQEWSTISKSSGLSSLGQCMTPNPLNTTQVAMMSEYLNLGLTYIDYVLSGYDADVENWLDSVTGTKYNTEGCMDFPTGVCEMPNPSDCSDGTTPPEVWWAQIIAATFYANLQQYYAAFQPASAIATLEIPSIASNFTPKASSAFNVGTFFSDVGSALDIGGNFLGSVSGYDELNEAVGMANTFWGLLDTNGQTLPDESTIEAILEKVMENVYSAAVTTFTQVATHAFIYPGNLTTYPSYLISGPYNTTVANFLYNMKPIYVVDSVNWASMATKVNSTIQQALAGAALGAADHYVIKFSAEPDDCTNTGDYLIDNICYSIGWPGGDTCEYGWGDGIAISQSTLDSLDDYDIDIEKMILSSEACQNKTGSYFGAIVGGSPPNVTDGYPDCFFNLPILQMDPADLTLTGYDQSPCNYRALNGSASTPIVGQTYLPDNLVDFFDTDACTCAGVYPGGGSVCKRDLYGRTVC